MVWCKCTCHTRFHGTTASDKDVQWKIKGQAKSRVKPGYFIVCLRRSNSNHSTDTSHNVNISVEVSKTKGKGTFYLQKFLKNNPVFHKSHYQTIQSWQPAPLVPGLRSQHSALSASLPPRRLARKSCCQRDWKSHRLSWKSSLENISFSFFCGPFIFRTWSKDVQGTWGSWSIRNTRAVHLFCMYISGSIFINRSSWPKVYTRITSLTSPEPLSHQRQNLKLLMVTMMTSEN